MITGYNFPEGVQYKLRYSIGWDFYDSSIKLPPDMKYGFVFKPIVTIKLWDASNVNDMSYMFQSCTYLTSIPLLNTSKVTNMDNMFRTCSSLTSIPQLDTSKVTKLSNAFYDCTSLTSIPQLDTSKVTTIESMLSNCTSLTSIPLLDCSSIRVGSYGIFGYYTLSGLTDIGGFKNLKASWTNYFLDKVPNATVESLMNVINNLWDWTDYPNGKVTNPDGVEVSYGTTHTLKFGTTNLNKLTAEQKAVATNKGWTLS